MPNKVIIFFQLEKSFIERKVEEIIYVEKQSFILGMKIILVRLVRSFSSVILIYVVECFITRKFNERILSCINSYLFSSGWRVGMTSKTLHFTRIWRTFLSKSAEENVEECFLYVPSCLDVKHWESFFISRITKIFSISSALLEKFSIDRQNTFG